MKVLSVSEKIYQFLRLGIVMCFIGHGAFGIITKPVWCNYFAVFGIGHDTAYHIMPFIGAFDILMGVLMLVFPMRAITIWLVIWGLFTASLRPLSGEPFAEFIERAGNFGVPAALLILCGGFYQNKNMFFKRIQPPRDIDAETMKRVFSCLRITVFLLLSGHGWLNLIEKTGLLNQYKSIGFTETLTAAHYIGGFEIASAMFILVSPFRPFLLAIFIWKMSTELFYPHYEFFEWVERGGSYTAILSLWYCMAWNPLNKQSALPGISGAFLKNNN